MPAKADVSIAFRTPAALHARLEAIAQRRTIA